MGLGGLDGSLRMLLEALAQADRDSEAHMNAEENLGHGYQGADHCGQCYEWHNICRRRDRAIEELTRYARS